MSRRAVLAVAALAAAAVLAACDERVSGGSGATSGDGATSKGTATVLCRAADAAERGDVDGAGDAFADVHGDLHDLAGRLSDGDGDLSRASAARLLQAKQRVEADLRQPPGGSSPLADDLRALAGVVGEVSAQPVPAGCR